MQSLALSTTKSINLENALNVISNSEYLFETSLNRNNDFLLIHKIPFNLNLNLTNETLNYNETKENKENKQNNKNCISIPFVDTKLIGFYYSQETDTVIIALGNGEIISISCQDWSPENLGIVDGGIAAIEPSPDGELVVVVNCHNQLLLMNREFDLISEFPISNDQQVDKDQAFVNVGWGKKETQFHGTAGKMAAFQISKDQMVSISVNDDLKPRISWRGDGDFFVVSFVANHNSHAEKYRSLNVYNREATLQGKSEKVPNLEHVLSWRPSGNLIASTQLLRQKQQIVFFERNGLRHGEFDLQAKNCLVHEIAWNIDSSILAINLTNNETKKSCLQLWGSKNYHWYLRQEIPGFFLKFYWDSESPLILNSLSAGGTFQSFRYRKDIFKSASLSDKSLGVVAVIDGPNCLFTPFKFRNVPPPMSNLQTTHKSPVMHLSFCPQEEGNRVAVLLNNGLVEFWKNIDGLNMDVKATLSSFLSLQEIPGAPRQISWISEKLLMALCWNSDKGKDELWAVEIDLGVHSQVALPCAVVTNLCFDPNWKTFSIQCSLGNIYELGQDNLIFEFVVKFPTPCAWMGVCKVGGDKAWIGLSERNKLYLNDRLLNSECSSFSIHNDFLIASTLGHIARFATWDNFGFIEDSDVLLGFNEKKRMLEQGARIVLAVPAHVNLVLEMPRGNLETIFPRALVLSRVRGAIEAKRYREAFITCRKHRIDMNILVDHDYGQFTACVELFVEQIPEPEFLNLFLTSLKDEDITITMYQSLVERNTAKSSPLKNKLNGICDMMRNVLLTKSDSIYNSSILTADAKKSPPDLQAAMSRIASIKINQSSDKAEESLKYLIFLVDVDSLFNVALGMYDFPLVLMVAQHSHKDPREYLPFLSNLKKMELNYRRFTIDDHLTKFQGALKHLSLCPDRKEEFINYMNKHKLFKAGLECFDIGDSMHIDVLRNFANYQYECREFEQAGMMFEMAGDFKDAIKCYLEALLWRELFVLCSKVGVNRSDYIETLAENLRDTGRHLELATIYLEFFKDPKTAIDVLVAGGHWSRAISVAVENNLDDLFSTLIRPALEAHCILFVNEIEGQYVTFETQIGRLEQVRAIKRQNPLEGNNGNCEIGNDDRLNDIDMFSDTSSMATSRITNSTSRSTNNSSVNTGMSVRTARTSRQKRKAARKRAAGRDVVYEDEFLIKALKAAVEKYNSQLVDLRIFLRTLMTQKLYSEAKKMQTVFVRYMNLIKENHNLIFDTPVLPIPMLNSDGNVESVSVSPQIISKPVISDFKWWLDCF